MAHTEDILLTVAPAQRRRMLSGNEGDVVGFDTPDNPLATISTARSNYSLSTFPTFFTVPLLEQSSTCSPMDTHRVSIKISILSGLNK
jgi:hypothetical protein